MTSKNKQKGNRFEREIVNIAKSLGLEAQRAYASDGRSLGCSEKVDVLLANKKLQLKARKTLPKWLSLEDVDAVIIKADRQDPLVLIPLAEYLELLK